MLHLKGKENISFHTRKHAVCMLIILLRVRYNFAAGYILVRCDIQNLMCCLLDFILKSPNKTCCKRFAERTHLQRLHQIMLPTWTCAVLKHCGATLPLQTATMNSSWVSSLSCERHKGQKAGLPHRTLENDVASILFSGMYLKQMCSRALLRLFVYPRVSTGFFRSGKSTVAEEMIVCEGEIFQSSPQSSKLLGMLVY